MSVDPDKVAALIAEIAAEHITPRYGKLSDDAIRTKTGPNDFVTEADLAAEAALQKALTAMLPGSAFIGEEIAASDPGVLDKIDDAAPVWIVDPLDGTRNFVQGRDEFGSIVALVHGGETRMGWIYAIPHETCAIGVKGGGATWGGERLGKVAQVTGALAGFRAVGSLKGALGEQLVAAMREHLETEPARCSAYAYIALARGEADFALYSRAHPWDHAAGALILNEIGGRDEYLDDGSAYTPAPTLGRPLLAAGSSENWVRVKNILLESDNA